MTSVNITHTPPASHIYARRHKNAVSSRGPWLPGDYALLDIDDDGIFGKRLAAQDRELALGDTFSMRV